MEDLVVISSFSPAALEQVRDLAPDLVTAVLYNTEFHSGRDPVDIVDSLEASAFNIKRTRLSSEMMERCRSNRIPVAVYTVNKKRHMRRLVKKGVNAIFTDHPDRMLTALGRDPAAAMP